MSSSVSVRGFRKPVQMLSYPVTPAYSNFVVRSGSLGADDEAYRILFSRLTTAGFFDPSTGATTKLQGLHVLCGTTSSSVSLLDLTAGANNLTNTGCTYTAHQGWTNGGVAQNRLDTGVNMSTASIFLKDSAHYGFWVNNSVTQDAVAAGGGTPNVDVTWAYPKLVDGSSVMWTNNDWNNLSDGFFVDHTRHHYLGNRSSSSAQQTYVDGIDQLTNSKPSAGPPNKNMWFCAAHGNSDGLNSGTHQLSVAHWGASLTQTEVTNLYRALRSFRASMGLA